MPKILDTELGARARAVLAAVGALATAIVLLLQDVLDVVHQLPSSGVVAKIAALLVGSITFVGRFTALGNVTKG